MAERLLRCTVCGKYVPCDVCRALLTYCGLGDEIVETHDDDQTTEISNRCDQGDEAVTPGAPRLRIVR